MPGCAGVMKRPWQLRTPDASSIHHPMAQTKLQNPGFLSTLHFLDESPARQSRGAAASQLSSEPQSRNPKRLQQRSNAEAGSSAARRPQERAAPSYQPKPKVAPALGSVLQLCRLPGFRFHGSKLPQNALPWGNLERLCGSGHGIEEEVLWWTPH